MRTIWIHAVAAALLLCASATVAAAPTMPVPGTDAERAFLWENVCLWAMVAGAISVPTILVGLLFRRVRKKGHAKLLGVGRLVRLAAVVAVSAGLAGVFVSIVSGAGREARTGAASNAMGQLGKALAACARDNNRYPVSLTTLYPWYLDTPSILSFKPPWGMGDGKWFDDADVIYAGAYLPDSQLRPDFPIAWSKRFLGRTGYVAPGSNDSRCLLLLRADCSVSMVTFSELERILEKALPASEQQPGAQ